MKYIKNTFNTFLNSFKLDIKFLYSVGVDLIFYIMIALTGYFFYSSFFEKILELSLINFTGMGIEQIGLVSRSFIISLFSMGVVVVVLFIFFYSMFKSLVWITSTHYKMTSNYRKNFSILASLWLLFWIFVGFLFKSSLEVKNVVIFALLFLIINYFTKILFISFINTKADIKKGFEDMIDISFKKFYLFCLPYLFEFVVLIILVLIVSTLRVLPTNLFYSMAVLAFLLYSAWTRRYFVSVVDSIKL